MSFLRITSNRFDLKAFLVSSRTPMVSRIPERSLAIREQSTSGQ